MWRCDRQAVHYDGISNTQRLCHSKCTSTLLASIHKSLSRFVLIKASDTDSAGYADNNNNNKSALALRPVFVVVVL